MATNETNNTTEYNPFTTIDLFNLHTEWARQSNEFHKHAKRLAKARDAVSRAKRKLDVTRADLNLDVRRCPKKFGLEDIKLSESAYSSAIERHPEYSKVEDELREAYYQMNMVQAAVDALDHRKKALENLVKLFLSDYWSEPKVRREVRDAFDDRAMRKRKESNVE